MEGGRVNDFIDAFSYQSVALEYKGEKYFSDGIISNKNGKFSFYIVKVNGDGEFQEDVYDFEGDTIADCIIAFENASIWDGKSFYEVEKDMKWVDW